MVEPLVKDLLEAGVHFGHQTRRWHPKMRRFIYGEKNGIYLVDLEKTAERNQAPEPQPAEPEQEEKQPEEATTSLKYGFPEKMNRLPTRHLLFHCAKKSYALPEEEKGIIY